MLHTYVRTYVYTYILTYLHTDIHTYTQTDRQTDRQTETDRQTDIQTYIHTAYIHRYIHTHVHTYIHCIPPSLTNSHKTSFLCNGWPQGSTSKLKKIRIQFFIFFLDCKHLCVTFGWLWWNVSFTDVIFCQRKNITPYTTPHLLCLDTSTWGCDKMVATVLFYP